MTFITIIIAALLIAADQYTKRWAATELRELGSVTVIDKVFSFTYVENTGAAFGLFEGGRWFFVLTTLAVLVGLFMYYLNLPRARRSLLLRLPLLLITAGAVGNLIDRFLNGFVVDFLHATFINFPVFNLADVYVVCGTVLFAALLLFAVKEDEIPLKKTQSGASSND